MHSQVEVAGAEVEIEVDHETENRMPPAQSNSNGNVIHSQLQQQAHEQLSFTSSTSESENATLPVTSEPKRPKLMPKAGSKNQTLLHFADFMRPNEKVIISYYFEIFDFVNRDSDKSFL